MALVNQNLKHLRLLRNMTQKEFAKKLGIKYSSLGAYEEERALPNNEVLFKLCDMFKLSLDELMRKDLREEKTNYLAKRRAMKLDSERTAIPFVPEKAAAGYLSGYSDAGFVDELNTFTIPMVTSGNYRAFEIVGDSMLPTPSGSVIIAEKVEGYEEIKNNLAYIVVSRTDGILYKRIVKNNKSKEKITLVSDNPSFTPYQMPLEDVAECWAAKYVFSKVEKDNRWNYDSLAAIVNQMQSQITKLNSKK